MPDTDILLSIDLDTKDALQTAKTLGKEIEKAVSPSEKSSAGMSSLDSQLKQASIKAKELVTKLEEIGETKVPTAEYQEISKRLQDANTEFDKLLTEQEKLAESGQTWGVIWDEHSKKMDEQGEKIHAIEAEMKELEKSGKAFTLGKDTKQYEEVSGQLDKINDKTKLLLIKKRELAKKEAGTAEGGLSGAMGSFTAISKGATKTLGIVKALSKTLKRGLLTLAAFTLGARGLMGLINKLRDIIKEGFKAIYEGDAELKKQVDDLKNSWGEVKANITAAFLPIIEMAIPYIQKLLDWVNLLLNKIAMFVAAIAGQNAYTKAIKKTGDAAAGASKQLSKFDELNNLSSGGGAGGEFDLQKSPVDEKVIELAEKLKAVLGEIKEFAQENIFKPFKEGFNSAVGDLPGKIATIKENLSNIKDSLVEIFSSPEVQEAQQKYTQSFSKFCGELVGLGVNTGINIGEALTGGTDKFLKDNKDEIQQDMTDTYNVGAEIFDSLSGITDAISKIIDQIGESETLVSAISHALDIFYNISTMVQQVYLQIYAIFLDVFGPSITNNVDKFKGLLESLFSTIDKVMQFYDKASQTVKDAVLNIIKALRPVYEEIGQILADVVAGLIDVWTNTIAPILDDATEKVTEVWEEYVQPIVNDIVSIISDSVAVLTPILKALWEDLIQPLFNWIVNSVVPILVPIIKILFEGLFMNIKIALSLIKTLFDFIKNVVGFIKALIDGDVTGAMNYLKEIITGGFNSILDILKIVFESAKNIIMNIISIIQGLVQAVIDNIEVGKANGEALVTHIKDLFGRIKSTLDGVKANAAQFWKDIITDSVTAINNLIGIIESGLNGIVGKIAEIGIIDKVNDLLGTNISGTVSLPRIPIPALAQGAVIPPSMGDFIARLGDNDSETEVVSPLSTMKQALVEALQEAGGSGGNISVQLVVDGNVLADTVVRQNEIHRRQTGRPLFAM